MIFIAAAFTAIWGVILGAPTLRLRGDYLAIVTLAFGEIVPRVFENATSGIFGIGSTDFSNGRQGITPIDKVNFPWTDERFSYPLELKPIYYVGLAMVLLVIFLNVRLRDSRLGRAWIAVREDEVAAAAMGVNLVRTKLWAYALGAALGGFAGVFLGDVQQHRQRRPVRVRLLGVHPVHGHHRRDGQHLGRHARRRRAVDAEPLRAASSSTTSPRRSAWTST